MNAQGMLNEHSHYTRRSHAHNMPCTCILYAHEHAHCMLCAFAAYTSWACTWNDFKTFFGRFKVDAHSHGIFLEKWGMCRACSMRIRIARAGRMHIVYAMFMHIVCP